MDNKKLNKNEVSIHSACDIDSTLLLDFYKKAFPDKINCLKSNRNLELIDNDFEHIK